jgi:leader peptidase (prepilin peptidase)/N-methyltransferase
VVGIGVMAAGRGGRKTRIPFGPFLAAGAMVAVLWGNPLVHALFHRGT